MTPKLARTLVVLSVAAGACSDGASRRLAPDSPSVPPIVQPTAVGMRATVDLVAGTMTFAPATPMAAPGIQRAIYGGQDTLVKIYNGAVTVVNPSRAGKKSYTGSVGVQNLLTFPIGDEQAAPVPADIMGIYVILNSPPAVMSTSSACSPACTVTATNTDGALKFGSLTPQPYWFYPERLGAAGTATDRVAATKSWVFEADTQVKTFAFDVLVSAPWSAPHETRFKIDYQGDSLPDTQSEPKWRPLVTGTGTSSNTAGILRISPSNNGAVSYYRLDSLGILESAYIEASIKFNGQAGNNGNSTEPEIVLDDGVRFIALGIDASSAGFVTAARGSLGTRTQLTTTTSHVYQLRKYGADSAAYYIDGIPKGRLAYTSFSLTPYPAASSRVQFGHYTSQNTASSDWDYVIYELGAAFP